MTALKNKINRIKSIVSSIENASSASQIVSVNEEFVADSELLIVQINGEENEFLFI